MVSHAGFYNYLLAALLKMPDREGIWFVLNNAAIARIDFLDENPDGAEHTALVYMNRAGFLPEELIT